MADKDTFRRHAIPDARFPDARFPDARLPDARFPTLVFLFPSLVDQTTPPQRWMYCITSTRKEGLATLAAFETQRNAYNWEMHITACSVVTSIC